MRWLRNTVVIAVLVVLCFALLRWTRGPEESPSSPGADLARAEFVPPADRDPEPCENLAVADALLAVTRAEIDGRPEPFPSDAVPGVSPSDFLADLDALKRDCKGVSVDHVDCEEYPCLAWISATPCAAKDAFQVYDVRQALGLPSGDILSWDMVYRLQPNERLHAMRAFDVNRFDRTETRRRAALAALELKTGGSPLTELERATEDAAITRSQLDVTDPDDPDHKAMQRSLEEAERRIRMARHAERGRVPSPDSLPVVEPTPASTCAEAVAQRLARIDELRRAAYGNPAEFPADLESYLQPDAVEARARRVMTECPQLGWTLHEVDCSEYPCITLWDSPDLDGHDLDDCPAWGEVRTQGTAARMIVLPGPDGEKRQLIALAQYNRRPDDTWDIVPAGGRSSRFELRTTDALMQLEDVVRRR